MSTFLWFVCLMAAGYIFGSSNEKKHLKDLDKRDQRYKHIILSNAKTHDFLAEATSSHLITGHTVIALDYFKMFSATIINFIGGRVGVYENLLARARREAILRMKEKASFAGYDTIVNLKIETSNIGGTAGQKGGLGAIEIIAYGTAVRR